MKHTHIAAILGWTEVHETAEGIFLQPEELGLIDSSLGRLAASEQAVTDLVTANETIAARDLRITKLEIEAGSNATTIGTQATRIAELEAQVETLGGQSSGKGSTVKPVVLEMGIEETADAKPRFDSPNHPANKFADAQKAYDSGIPAKK
jgi:hypothetical protein